MGLIVGELKYCCCGKSRTRPACVRIPRRPIIRQEYDGYWLIDGGDGKHYLWEYVEGIFLEVYERDLAKILAIQHWSTGGWMTLSRIGIVERGSKGYSAA